MDIGENCEHTLFERNNIMKQELDKKLVEKYPKIFADRHKDMRKTAMCWGFECGDGWYNIIDILCNEIQRHIDHMEKRKTPVEQVVASQVKEKFGGLRFYVYGGDDTVYAMLDMAESLSLRTCEVCGNVGKPSEGGWIKTLCEEHAKEAGYLC